MTYQALGFIPSWSFCGCPVPQLGVSKFVPSIYHVGACITTILTNSECLLFLGSHVALRASRCRTWNILEHNCALRCQSNLVRHNFGSFDDKFAFNEKRKTRLLASAASEQPIESDPGAYHPQNRWKSMQNALDAFYRFSRPHTVIGTVRFKFNWMYS